MMARNFVQTSGDQYLTQFDAIETNGAGIVSFGCWYRLTASPSSGCMAACGNLAGSLVNYRFLWRNVTGTMHLEAMFTEGLAANVRYSATPTINASTWYHAFFVVDLSTNPDTVRIFHNGVSQTVTHLEGGTNTTRSQTVQVKDHPRIGAWMNTTLQFKATGDLAEMVLTFDNWTDTEVAMLAKGLTPLALYGRHRSAWGWYYPLFGRNSPETAPTGESAATVTGATYQVHPPIYQMATVA